METYYDLVKRVKPTRANLPTGMENSVMDPEVQDRHKMAEQMEAIDLASNFVPGKAGASALLGGIIRGRNALTWSKPAAEQFLRLTAQRISPFKKWQNTGTLLGPEGFLRQEIPDIHAELDTDTLKKLVRLNQAKIPEVQTTMENVLYHPELYRAYPDMRNTKLVITPGNGGASYLRADDRVTLNPVRYSDIEQGNVKLSHLLHELQHGVQRREGFAPGGSVSRYNAAMQAMARAAQQNKMKAEYRFDPQTGQFYNDLKQEIDVRGADPYKAYKELAGEAEARAVEARMGMPLEAREAKSPHASYDVDTVTYQDPVSKKWQRFDPWQ